MKILITFCLLAGLTTAISAQQLATVTGTAVNRSQVTLTSVGDSKTSFSIEADSEGKFVFENIPPGEYRITADGGALAFSMFGEKRITVVPGTNGPVEVPLRTMTIRETVTVSADSSQSLEEVSKTVDVIDAQEMRDRADFTLIDALRSIPGFRVQQLGGFGRTASIKSRGLRNQDTAVLLDGIRFRDPGAITGDATPFLSDITLTSVNRIEVLRGSGSSLYGTNAVGGTIDFKTPVAQDGFHGQVSGALGGLGLGRFRTNLSYGNDKVSISGAFSRTAYTEGIDGNDNADNNNFQSRIDVRPTDQTTVSGRVFFSGAKVRLNVSPDTLGVLPPSTATIIDAEEGVNFIPDADDPDSIQKSKAFSGQFVVNHVVNKYLTIAGHYQGMVTDRRNDDGPLGPGFQSQFTSIFGGTIHTANIHAVWTPSGSNTFTGGYEFESENFRNEGDSDFSGPFRTEAEQHSNTLYAQHLVHLLDGNLQFAGGVRAQWFELGTPSFSQTDGPYVNRTFSSPPAAYTFDGAASYFLQKTGTKFRTHVGNGYRAPSMYERFGTFFSFGSFFPQGNPELKPERSLGVDAGIEQFLFGDRLKASATWFYTKVKDEITYLPTDDFGAPVYYNFDRHYSRGAEFSVDAKPTSSTNIFASYTFTNSDVRNGRRTFLIVDSTDRKSFGIPDHQFTLVATQHIKKFWVSLDLLATSSYLAPVFSNTDFRQYTYRFDGNARADLTAGYTFNMRKNRNNYTIRTFGTIENLFDNEYFENGFRTAGVSARFGVSFGF
ncbi:MAG TPA: TonB-dependent receptor [Pyrinomonadaceae bacterium]|nr:TonB-dependent receptor [Pyrinomonadaceae bacterium]